jgi:hypothetical protein
MRQNGQRLTLAERQELRQRLTELRRDILAARRGK